MIKALEKILFASRWFLAPFYLALMVGLGVLLVKAGQHSYELALHGFAESESSVLLNVLGLVDLTLTASLVVIVIFSGYENFVARVDQSEHRDWPAWLGQIDFAQLKQKLLASIVAIAAVQVLRALMDVNHLSDRELMWSAILLGSLVMAALILALCDRIAGQDDAAH